MICLGIEGTAHTLGIGIIKSGRILADIRRTYKPKNGIHPREAAQFISKNMKDALYSALSSADLKFDDIDLIAFSQGPGLGPCLRTIATASRVLSLHYKIPIIGVNHCVAHIEIGRILCKMRNPLALYVSGGNTQILMLKDGRYRIFGETLDIGIGNMLDKFGRAVRLGHPAGPIIENLAKNGKNFIELPYVVKGTDLSFSGILTSAINKFKSKKYRLEDICFSLQETAFAMLTEVTERALAHLKARELLLTGGVGNNKRLQEMLREMAKEHDARFDVPEGYCSDNGVMIAFLGELMYKSGIRHKLEDTIVKQKFRTDSVEVIW
ncbi:MAG: bifunctional N(6)-L-threonylcarbamoyladenine synthase/serine/threonine protein kinase [Candidatus Altiarchaeales archaeon]|nr:MAG: bifunctional N(6)-L-threonylcarbamoyladenine synthase/serine/threonine protein kinase [Candidatus Altiarchaeales archaeon]